MIRILVICIVIAIVSCFVGHLSGYREDLSEGYEIGQFAFYYVKPSGQKYGMHDLEEELEGLKWIKPYQENVFDCSETIAYLEWRLENEGWHTIIVVGNCPFNSGKHAWLLVETSANLYTPVETTNIKLVRWNDSHFDEYFNSDDQFESIEEATDYSPTEFDWWE